MEHWAIERIKRIVIQEAVIPALNGAGVSSVQARKAADQIIELLAPSTAIGEPVDGLVERLWQLALAIEAAGAIEYEEFAFNRWKQEARDILAARRLSAQPTRADAEGSYPAAHLPLLLRDQVVTVLRCEAEQHVIDDAVRIVEQAADRLAALAEGRGKAGDQCWVCKCDIPSGEVCARCLDHAAKEPLPTAPKDS